jgi:hypothetical protein
MKKRTKLFWYQRLLDLFFEKTPKSFGFFRRWAVMALPGLGLWAWKVPLIPFPGREWVSGSFAILAVAAWYAAMLPEPIFIGIWTCFGMALVSISISAWAVGQSAWVAWVLFYAATFATTKIKDGRLVLSLWCVLWGAAAWTFPSVWWVPLLFAWSLPPIKTGRLWLRWGALSAALCLAVLALARGQMWSSFGWSLGMTYDWLGTRGFLIPMLMVWLGAAFVGKKSFLPWWAAQLAGWTFAWCWAGFPGVGWMNSDALGLGWLSATGFGVASLRRDLLDRSWHARVLWVALAVTLWVAYR